MRSKGVIVEEIQHFVCVPHYTKNLLIGFRIWLVGVEKCHGLKLLVHLTSDCTEKRFDSEGCGNKGINLYQVSHPCRSAGSIDVACSCCHNQAPRLENTMNSYFSRYIQMYFLNTQNWELFSSEERCVYAAECQTAHSSGSEPVGKGIHIAQLRKACC